MRSSISSAVECSCIPWLGPLMCLLRTVRVPGGEAVGSSLTRDGRLLLVASGRGATVPEHVAS